MIERAVLLPKNKNTSRYARLIERIECATC